MSNYTLNGKPLADFGFIPGQVDGSNLAIAGAWDMPSRIGKVFHEWADQASVEPYLRADELFFGGVDLRFRGLVQRNLSHTSIGQLLAYYEEIDGYNTLVPFSCDFGTWNVYIQAGITAQVFDDNWAVVEQVFRMPVQLLTGVLPLTGGSSDPGIDGYTFDQLGVLLLAYDVELNRPAIHEGQYTVYGREGYQLTKRGFNTYTRRFLVDATNYAGFNTIVTNFRHLLSLPGKRVLRLDDGLYREVFCKDGFRVTDVYFDKDRVTGVIEVAFTEIRIIEQYKVFETNNTQFANKHGQRLAWIIKGT